ncbi:ribosomal RNA-processing protein 7-domain-containing protein [Amylostereum chailletii]|nr:ribosomal RNA-processing protein 7-domain-containing protein [Amylostereum chailletii]
MSSRKTPHSLGGFSILPISYSSTSQHIIYIRAQDTSSKKAKATSTWPEERTLFMVNVPPDATERQLVLLFRSCGTVEKVVFDSDPGIAMEEGDVDASESEAEAEDEEEEEGSDEGQPRKKRKLVKVNESEPQPPKVTPILVPTLRCLHKTGHTAHVVFLDASSLTRALALAQPAASSSQTPLAPPRPWPKDSSTPIGLSHYVALYDGLRPPLDVVRAHANTSMDLYDFEQQERKHALQKDSKYRKGEAIVDEDGFTLVTRGGAYGKAVGGGVGVASKKFVAEKNQGGRHGSNGSGRKRKAKGGKEKDAFYAFQVHEKKRKALMDLKSKWEEDKAAVEKLKASRRFKPY